MLNNPGYTGTNTQKPNKNLIKMTWNYGFINAWSRSAMAFVSGVALSKI